MNLMGSTSLPLPVSSSGSPIVAPQPPPPSSSVASPALVHYYQMMEKLWGPGLMSQGADSGAAEKTQGKFKFIYL